MGLETAFDKSMRETVEGGKLAGAVVWAKDRQGHVQCSRSYGVERLEGERMAPARPMSMDTVFRLASSSKLVTTIAVLQLVEQGRIGLDDDVTPHVPELSEQEVLTGFTWYGKPLTRPRDPGTTFTMRALLTHTSGIGYDFLRWQPLWRVRWWKGEAVARGDSLEERLSFPLLHDPGRGWTYGSGVTWAGRVLERITGSSLEAWIATHIAAPLGLKTLTFFPHRQPEISARLAGMTRRSPWTGRVSAAPDPSADTASSTSDTCMGGEGVHCSMGDFSEILCSLLADDGRLLKPETAALMFTKQLSPEQRTPLHECLNLPVWISQRILLPGKSDWGLGGALVDKEAQTPVQDGTLMWSGIYHVLWSGVCGLFASQLTPATDPIAIRLIVGFQKEVYRLLQESSREATEHKGNGHV